MHGTDKRSQCHSGEHLQFFLQPNVTPCNKVETVRKYEKQQINHVFPMHTSEITLYFHFSRTLKIPPHHFLCSILCFYTCFSPSKELHLYSPKCLPWHIQLISFAFHPPLCLFPLSISTALQTFLPSRAGGVLAFL